ncbi:DENN domain-containing protein 1B [Acipenser ruthenus]|uniref:DENN domain-containing protein 1B n=1 Tax=Acipenser ruthenus TaxID=7906 RepID=A0A444UGL4_ACIRT|nr:DENN domain-containing protein 1B [Acipenser ruthenus]
MKEAWAIDALSYNSAPMPYVVGVHLSLLEKVKSRTLEDVVILNVDTNTLETPFDDLQNLPSDVISTLKSKLKKQSTATGSGVAMAFLRTQAALFGSYRDALRYKPGEPISFCEDSFINHRSSTMRAFLKMAVNLQLFKQRKFRRPNTSMGCADFALDDDNEMDTASKQETSSTFTKTTKAVFTLGPFRGIGTVRYHDV